MSRIAKYTHRSYRSELRDEQAEATRTRILDATLRVMAGGLATLSIPAVAREARVSVPTVYRHFGTKQDLLEAVYPHVVKFMRPEEVGIPSTVAGIRDLVPMAIAHIESIDEVAMAALLSPAGAEARRASMPTRLRLTREFTDGAAPELSEADRDRLARLIVVLTSSSTLRTLHHDLGRSPEEVADDVEWVLRSVIDANRMNRRKTS
jgi:AcrR family transcriptional regulator